jgi:glycine/D-amino acid oxidase-like deaminating enzyme
VTALWWDQLDESERTLTRPPLNHDIECDVVIVGAGFTGLWTAYWLKQLQPQLDVVVVEAEVAGFGASGRNGGWCSALFPASLEKIAHLYDRASALAMHRTLQEYVPFIGQTLARENIDCDWNYSGDVYLARSAPQLARAKAEIAEWRQWGFEEQQLLSDSEAQSRLQADNVLGGTYSPHCARIQPAKLVRGLAHAVEKLGVRIFEHSPAISILPREVKTSQATIKARTVVRATEGFTARLPDQRRTLIPVYSLMVATEPLSDSDWTSIGLNNRELFADYRHLIIYGQRTADNRIAFGGRGAPYHYASSIKSQFDSNRNVHRGIQQVLIELLPQLGEVKFTHQWGGPLAIPRDWFPSVHFDAKSGFATAGGYVGDGVATSALAGHTLAELITGTESERTRLPWVNHQSPQWEFEPLRWIEANAGLRMMTVADVEERITRRESVLAKTFEKISGR